MPLSSASSEQRTHRSISKATAKKEGSIKMGSDPLAGAVQIVEGRLYYNAFVRDPRSYDSDLSNYTYITSRQQQGRDDDPNQNVTKRKVHLFSIDSELVYWNFFLDFGPLNLGQLFRFCQKLNTKLQDPRLANRVICFFSNTSFEKRANAMYLLAAWQVLYMRRSPEEACMPFQSAIFNHASNSAKKSKQNSPRSVVPRNGSTLDAIPPFHDASPCECSYDLNILDCLRGLVKARANNFFNFDDFDVKEYEYFEQVENGDLNWIVKNKFLAFAGPQYKKTVTREGCYILTAEHYVPYFKSRNVGLVVRLNKALYDENSFKYEGIDHFEQFYTDGSCPTLPMLRTILQAFEAVDKDKGIAVHCKAGLGRTGTCIGAYMMKHYKFTAKEAIGWMRICRPGMVIGPQQHFLEDIEKQMWYEGEIMRLRPSPGLSPKERKVKKDRSGSLLGIQDLSVADQQGGHQYDPESDAVRGRAGQADALLSRRGNGTGTHRQRAP